MRLPSKVHGPRGLGYADLPPTDRRLTDYDSASRLGARARTPRPAS